MKNQDAIGLTLVHSVYTWLPLTEGWIFNQVKNITQIEQLVLADKFDKAYPEKVETIFAPKLSQMGVFLALRSRLGITDYFRRISILRLKRKVVLLSHYGTRGFQDLNLPCAFHLVRFYGFDLQRIYQSDKVWKSRYSLLFERANYFVAEGEFMARELVKMGCPMKKIWVHHLGVDLSNYNYSKRNAVAPVLQVLVASAFAERKGIIYALKAIAKYHQSGKKIHLHFVGARISDYPPYLAYEKEVEEFFSNQKMDSFTTRYGLIEAAKLKTIASKCHVLLHPSVWAADGDSEGGYPMVIAEMMATGLPVITTSHCDIPDLVNPSNGWLCREKNIEDILNALMEINDEVIMQKGFKARKWIEEYFDAAQLGKQFEERILNLVSNG